MVRRACVAVAVAVLCQGSADCCDEAPVLLDVDDFEACEEELCGWRVAGGTPERTVTFAEGEHGLRLDGGTRIEKDWGPDDAPRAVTELDALVDCTPDARLVLVSPGGASSNVAVGRGRHGRVLERMSVAVIDEPSTVILEARGDGSCLVDDFRRTSTRASRCQ